MVNKAVNRTFFLRASAAGPQKTEIIPAVIPAALAIRLHDEVICASLMMFFAQCVRNTGATTVRVIKAYADAAGS